LGRFLAYGGAGLTRTFDIDAAGRAHGAGRTFGPMQPSVAPVPQEERRDGDEHDEQDDQPQQSPQHGASFMPMLWCTFHARTEMCEDSPDARASSGERTYRPLLTRGRA